MRKTVVLLALASVMGIPMSASAQTPEAACLEALFRDVKFRDPDSVKVGAIERRGLFKPAAVGRETRAYRLQVNAKNAYGGYTGEQPYYCFTDPVDERKALLVQPLDAVR